MSFFGSTVQTQPQTGGLFGSTQQNQGGGLFGNSQQNQPQQGTGLFGSTQQNQPQQNQPQQGTGLFASLNTNTQQNQTGGGLFGSLNTNTQQNQNQQGGGLFGGLNTQQQQQPTTNAFGGFGQPQQQQQPQQGTGLFGSLGQSTQQQQQPSQQGTGLFAGLGQSTQQQPQQQQTNAFGGLGQSQQQGSGLFGGFGQSVQPQQQQQNQTNGFNLGSSQLWQPELPHQKSVTDQIATVVKKWDTTSPDCAFRYYFYNKVGEDKAPYYGPSPNEDPKAWEEALSKKPGPGYIPVLCVGFEQMGERIKTQQANLAVFNQKLHEINNSLEAMLSRHDIILSVRALDAKRKHTVLKQRCLALATKVQILRNKGYTMEHDEQQLKEKLATLERHVMDPALNARAEEIWARMVGVRERARVLKEEMGKRARNGNEESLDEESVRRAEMVLEAYGQQLQHVKKEILAIQEDLKEWEKEQGPPSKTAR